MASDPTTQLQFACERLFPDGSMSLEELEEHLENADAIDYVLYSSRREISEFLVVSGVEHCHVEYFNRWLSPHNSSVDWSEPSNCENATEVAERLARGGWSILDLHSNTDSSADD